jgi:hypothetical protein
LLDGGRQVTDGEPGDRPGVEVVLARTRDLEHLDVIAGRHLEHPEARLMQDQRQAK